ncbi:MAG: hypothetical protein Q9M35_10755 [Rhodothermus sp.]|nr:hypothetical protein [Rhodothermus sp.]
MCTKINRLLVGLGLLLLVPGIVWAQDKAALMKQSRPIAQPQHPRFSVLDVNNSTVWIRNDGKFDWVDPFSGVNGTMPKRTAGPVFAQGFLWGGKVMDGKAPVVRVNGSTYETGLDPGRVLWDPMTGTVQGPDEISLEKYHVWRVHRRWKSNSFDVTAAAAYFFGKDPSEVTDADRQAILDQYEYDWNNWPAEWGAPYQECNGQPGYQPAQDTNGDGEFDCATEGDIPGYPGADQTLWIVTNDLRQGTSERSYGSPAIGMEYQLTIWGYDFPATNPLGNIAFMRARLIYTGTPETPADARIDSMFVVWWVDPDVGTYSDDFAGSDTTLSLGYAYNANPRDDSYEAFNLPPPAVGWDFLQGPVNAQGDTLGMTAFVYFAAGSDISDPDLGEYSGTLQWYNLMRGYRPRPEYPAGDPFIDPNTGQPTKFTLTGDPVTGRGWIDGQQLPPGDRRIVLSSGPFTMQKGDTVEVVVGQIAALGTNNLSSISLLKYYDLFAQFAYDNDFVLPSPPGVPPVQVAELDEQIVLDWGFDLSQVAQVESYRNSGFEFEGYNVYQLPSPTASVADGVRLATFDKKNLITIVFDNAFDPATGFVLEKPVQFGADEGIKRYFTVTQDAIRQRPLANGVTYYFAITSYAVLTEDVEAPFRVLESSPVVVAATPQPPKPGYTEPPAPESDVEISHTGASTSEVQVKIANPTRVQNGTYSLEFAYYDPATGTTKTELAPEDTLTTVDGLFEHEQYSDAHRFNVGDPWPLRWRLLRDGQPISDWMPQIDPDGPVPPQSVPVIEGLQVYVPFVVAQIADWTWEGTRWVSGVNWGGEALFGGASIGAHFFGSTLPDDQLAPVVLEFQGDTTSGPADGWASKGAVYIRGEGYAYAGTGYLPFAAYEIQPDGSRRQVNVSFVELDLSCSNMRWDMGMLTGRPECQDLGGREYVFIHKSDYNEGADYNNENWAPAADVMYAFWPQPRGSHPYLEAPFSLYFYPAIALTPNDQYTFTIQGIVRDDPELKRQAVEQINVFPNPYFGFSRLETNRFQKFVTFTHLPEKATIRIFTLAGIPVRVIEHDSPSQFERWDLTNQDGIPVASGIYLVHIDTPYGEKVLKLAIVQEEQILQRY